MFWALFQVLCFVKWSLPVSVNYLKFTKLSKTHYAVSLSLQCFTVVLCSESICEVIKCSGPYFRYFVL